MNTKPNPIVHKTQPKDTQNPLNPRFKPRTNVHKTHYNPSPNLHKPHYTQVPIYTKPKPTTGYCPHGSATWTGQALHIDMVKFIIIKLRYNSTISTFPQCDLAIKWSLMTEKNATRQSLPTVEQYYTAASLTENLQDYIILFTQCYMANTVSFTELAFHIKINNTQYHVAHRLPHFTGYEISYLWKSLVTQPSIIFPCASSNLFSLSTIHNSLYFSTTTFIGLLLH